MQLNLSHNQKVLYEGELKRVDKDIADLFKDNIGLYRTGEPTLMQISKYLAKLMPLLEKKDSMQQQKHQ